jgi:hypothetical protein
MIKVFVNGRDGLTSSVVPHSNGMYPIWFTDADDVEFVESKDVIFIEKITNHKKLTH